MCYPVRTRTYTRYLGTAMDVDYYTRVGVPLNFSLALFLPNRACELQIENRNMRNSE